MLRSVKLTYVFVTLLLALMSRHHADAQVDSLISAGDHLHRIYQFDKAVDAFDLALDQVQDSVLSADSFFIDSISKKILLSENGSNMAGFVRQPKVLGRGRFSLNDFVLY